MIEQSLSYGIKSVTEDRTMPIVDAASISCGAIANPNALPLFGGLPSIWSFKANLTGISNGIHELTLSYLPDLDNSTTTRVCRTRGKEFQFCDFLANMLTNRPQTGSCSASASLLIQ